MPSAHEVAPHEIAVVVPVYGGERTLEALISEIEPLTAPRVTPAGHRFRVSEVLLVHDGAADDSAAVMQSLAGRKPFVRLLWLSRNFGQHPATLAGMASTVAAWVATMDSGFASVPVSELELYIVGHGGTVWRIVRQ